MYDERKHIHLNLFNPSEATGLAISLFLLEACFQIRLVSLLGQLVHKMNDLSIKTLIVLLYPAIIKNWKKNIDIITFYTHYSHVQMACGNIRVTARAVWLSIIKSIYVAHGMAIPRH